MGTGESCLQNLKNKNNKIYIKCIYKMAGFIPMGGNNNKKKGGMRGGSGGLEPLNGYDLNEGMNGGLEPYYEKMTAGVSTTKGLSGGQGLVLGGNKNNKKGGMRGWKKPNKNELWGGQAMLVAGGNSKKINQRGGHMLPYSPANIDGKSLDTNNFPLGAENYGRQANMFSSNVNPANVVQGGGAGFGYTNGGTTNLYAGSYAPIDRNCTGCEVGARGGNNFMSGGGSRRFRRKRKSSKNYTYKQKGCSRRRVKKSKKSKKGKKSRKMSRK